MSQKGESTKDHHREVIICRSEDLNKFEVDIDQLKSMMECRGSDGLDSVVRNYGSVNGLCKQLRTDPIRGE